MSLRWSQICIIAQRQTQTQIQIQIQIKMSIRLVWVQTRWEAVFSAAVVVALLLQATLICLDRLLRHPVLIHLQEMPLASERPLKAKVQICLEAQASHPQIQ